MVKLLRIGSVRGGMKLTAQILLRPTMEEAALLIQTMETANAACHEISSYAFAEKVFSKFKLQTMLG